jgi:enamine deaminase RidA (YjgF/YER057c/UK114 family)
MKLKIFAIATAVALFGLAGVANAQEISRMGGAPGGPFVSIAGVPMGGGMTMYFVSGALPTPVAPPANGQPANWGDTTQQTQSVFANLKKTMATAGLTLGDVVKATVYMGPELSFADMNKVWLTEFGTAAQPNKPARAAFFVHALAAPGAQLEIEFIAAKKN